MAAKVGKYLLFETLGNGTFGKVKLGVHEETGEQVAVKIMDKSIIQKSDLTMHVRREITIMKALKHKNIVNLHQVLTSSNKLYIVMDLVTGGELFDIIASKGEGGLAENDGRNYFQQMVDGVLYCHRRGVYHRDLKPENLLLNSDNVLKITDFGLSAIKGADTTTDLLTTQCGTPSYVAPEIIERASKGYEGEKVDAWASGIILFALTCGYLPFDGADMQELFRNIQNSEVEYPSWVSPGALDLMKKLLDKNPSKRWTLKQARDHPWFRINYEDEEENRRKSKSRRHRKTNSKTDYDPEALKPEKTTPPVSLRDASKPYTRQVDEPALATAPAPPPPPPAPLPVANPPPAAPTAQEPAQAPPSLPDPPSGLMPSRASFAQQSAKWQSMRKSIVFGEVPIPPPSKPLDAQANGVAKESPQATAPRIAIDAPEPFGPIGPSVADRIAERESASVPEDEKPRLSSLADLSRSEYGDRQVSNATNPGSTIRGSSNSDGTQVPKKNRNVRTSMLLSAALGDSLKSSTATAAVGAVGTGTSARSSGESRSGETSGAMTPVGVPASPPNLSALSIQEDDDDEDEGLAKLNDEQLEDVQAIRQLQTVIVMSRTQNLGVQLQGNNDFEKVLNLWSALEQKDIKERAVLDVERKETLGALRFLRDKLGDKVSEEEQQDIRTLLDMWERRLEGRSPGAPVDDKANRTFTNFEKLLNRWDKAIQGDGIVEEIDIPDSVAVAEEEDVAMPRGVDGKADNYTRISAGKSVPYSQESLMLLGNIPAAPSMPGEKSSRKVDAGRTSSAGSSQEPNVPYSQESLLLLGNIPAAPKPPPGVSTQRLSEASRPSSGAYSDESMLLLKNIPQAPPLPGANSSQAGSTASLQSAALLSDIPEPPSLPEEPFTRGTDAHESIDPRQHRETFSHESMVLLGRRPDAPPLPVGPSLTRLESTDSAALTARSSTRSSVEHYPEVPDLPEFRESDFSASESDTATATPSPLLPTPPIANPPAVPRAMGPSTGNSLTNVHAEPVFPDRATGSVNRPSSNARRPLGSRAEFGKHIPRDSMYDASPLTEAERLELLDDSIEMDDIPDDDEDGLRQNYLNNAWDKALAPKQTEQKEEFSLNVPEVSQSSSRSQSRSSEKPESPDLTLEGPPEMPPLAPRGQLRVTDSTVLDPARSAAYTDPHAIVPRRGQGQPQGHVGHPIGAGTVARPGPPPPPPPPAQTVPQPSVPGATGPPSRVPAPATASPTLSQGSVEKPASLDISGGVAPLSGRSGSSGGKAKILNKLLGRKGFTSGFPLEKCLNEMGKLLTSLHCQVIRKRGEFKLKAVAQATKGTKVQASIEMTSEANGRTLVLFKKAKAEFGRQADTQTFLEFYNAVVDNFNKLGPEAVLND